MSKHIGSYSQYHGPAGKVLTDYTELNIPALWNAAPERITSVANTGAQYTGVIPGYTTEDPLIYTENKFFFFTPHVNSLTNPQLSLNGLPLLPIVAPGDISPLLADALIPTGDYLLWIKNNRFELLLDLRGIAESLRAATKVTQQIPSDLDIATYEGGATILETAGFYAARDGGGKLWYRGTTEEPSSPPLPAFFSRQAFDGHWYEAISKRTLSGESIGILNSTSDFSDNINDAVAWLNSRGGGKLILPPINIQCHESLIVDGDGLHIAGTSIGNQNTAPGTTLTLGPNQTVRIGGDATTGGTSRRFIQFSDFACQQAAGTTAYFFTSLAIRNLAFRNLGITGLFGFHRSGNTTPLGATFPNFTHVVSYQNIEGNLSGSPSQHFLYGLNTGSFYIDHCVIEGTNPPTNDAHAIHFPSTAITRPDGAWIDSSGFARFDRGLSVERGIGNLFVSNTWFDGMKRHGVYIVPNSPVQGVRFSNCHFASHPPFTTDQIGIVLGEAAEASSAFVQRISFDNCQILQFGRQGLSIRDPTSNISIIGNHFEDNCLAPDNPAPESVITIGTAVNDLIVAHNQIYKRGVAGYPALPKYGINCASTQQKLSIVHNQIEPSNLLPGGQPVYNPFRGPAHVRRIHSNTLQVFEGQVVQVGPWIGLNIPTVASVTTFALPLANVSAVTQSIVQRRGKIVSISARANGNVTGQAGSIVFFATKNTVDTGQACASTAPPTDHAFDEDLDGNDFLAGDRIGVSCTTYGTYAPAGLDWSVFLSIYYD